MRLWFLAAAAALWLALSGATVDAARAANSSEAEALIEFKLAVANDSLLADWTDPASMCNWTGVDCSTAGQVRDL